MILLSLNMQIILVIIFTAVIVSVADTIIDNLYEDQAATHREQLANQTLQQQEEIIAKLDQIIMMTENQTRQ